MEARLRAEPRRTAHSSVLESLRQAILNGSLEAGRPLVLTDLSGALGVSKTPIREAIRDLAGEGLVDFDSYKSSVVHTPTLAEAREIYEMRLLLEPLSVRRSVGQITEEALTRAEELQREMVGVEEVGAWIGLNGEFHALLTDRDTAPLLNDQIVTLRNKSALQVAWSLQARPTLMEASNADHATIVESYRRRDEDAAVAATEHHLRATLEAIEAQGA
jgi:DNA-binding GntR family transcriptional regulator